MSEMRFGVKAAMLSEGITQEHGCAPSLPPYPAPDKKLIPIGQTLVGKTPNQSFGCVQCHSISQQPALVLLDLNLPKIDGLEVPTRDGGPSGHPVKLITPPMACTTMS